MLVPVGKTDAARALLDEVIEHAMSTTTDMVRRLRSPLASIVTVRERGLVPKIRLVSPACGENIVTPEVIRRCAELEDEIIGGLFLRRGGRVSETQLLQARIPVKMGALGLVSVRAVGTIEYGW